MVTFCCWCSQNLFHFSGLLLDDPPVFPFLTRTFYGYIWSGLLWSTTWLHLLQSLDSWREEKSWEEDRRRIKECSQAKTDRERLREVKINVLDIECRTCFFSLQDSGESCWPAARKLSHLQFTHGIFQGCGGGAKGSTCGKRRKWPAQKLTQTVNDFPLPFVKTGPKSYHRKTLKKWVLVNRLDSCDWWVRMPSIELTDVTLVSEHSF